MSDSSQVAIRYVEEGSWGVTPTDPVMQNLRFKGESLSKALKSVTSEEIRADRQVPDVTIVGADVNGNIEGELSYGTYDDFIAGALFNEWGTPVAMSVATISADDTDDSFNDSGSGFITAGIKVGQWLKIGGFTAPEDNGWFKVLTVLAGKITVDATLVTESPPSPATVDGTMIRNGVVEKSFSIEEEFSDITQFLLFTGMMVDTFNLSIESRQIVGMEFGFMGADAELVQATIADSETDATTSDVINAATNIASLLEGGAALVNTFAKTLNMSLANNVRALDGIGYTGNVGVGAGRCVVTGTLNIYFEDETYYDKMLSETPSAITVQLDDGINQYVMTIPKVKYTEGVPNASGPDEDVMLPLAFQGIRDPDTDCTIQIDKA